LLDHRQLKLGLHDPGLISGGVTDFTLSKRVPIDLLMAVPSGESNQESKVVTSTHEVPKTKHGDTFLRCVLEERCLNSSMPAVLALLLS
jgi:hypothetical protein